MLIDGRTGKPWGGPLPVVPPGTTIVNWTADRYCVAYDCPRCNGERSTWVEDGAVFGKWVECWDCERGRVYEWREG